MEESASPHSPLFMGQIAMHTKSMKNIRLSVFLILSITILGCAASSADLNRMAQDAFTVSKELNSQSAALDLEFNGVDRDTIRSALGKPRKISYEPYPYSLDRNCRGSHCEGGFSDEIWFYTFKKKFPSAWEAYSVYVYFKEGKVVRIR